MLWIMSGVASTNEGGVPSAEERMLIQMCDGLYEGDWDDFVHDLTSRLEGRPHVFQTVAVSADMQATMTRHLEIIARLRSGEAR